MTDRHDDDASWAPEDDELVRRALVSLGEDVSAEPLPEPAQIRARTEGRTDGGQVVHLDSRRRRRRSMALLAGTAAAVLVAAGAGLLVVNQSPDTPVATSTTGQPTSTSTGSTTAAPSLLRALGPAEWQSFLGIPIESTVPGEPPAQCFRPVDGTTWHSRSARRTDTTRVAGQWIGTSPRGAESLARSVDRSVADCDGYSRDSSISDQLPGGGTVRAWHNTGPDDVDVWWVEVTDGTSASFLAVTESDARTYTDEDIRTLARGVLGDVDLTAQSPTSTTTSTTSAPSTTTSTTTTSTPDPSSTTPGSSTTTSDPTRPTPSSTTPGSSTTTSDPTRPTPPVNTPTPPGTSAPVVGPIPSAAFIPPARWSSQVLTGGQPTTGATLRLEGEATIDPCASTTGASRAGGLGIRSGEGDDSFFGRQYILESESSDRADELVQDLNATYSGGSCEGARTISTGRIGVYAVETGDLTSYVAVVRQDPTTITILTLSTATTAPQPLTDDSAASELRRLGSEAQER